MIAFLIIKTIILLGFAGHQTIITILALCASFGYLSHPARPRCTQICVYPRAKKEKKKLLSCLLNLNKPIFKSSNARGVAFELIGALVRPKDALEPTKQDGIVYKIPCECGKVYIGETGRAMQDRIKEHDRDIRLARTQTSAVSEHANETGHLPIWKGVKFIDRDRHWYTRYPYKSSS